MSGLDSRAKNLPAFRRESVNNRDLAVALVAKYAPDYQVIFTRISNGEILRELKGLTDDVNKIIYFDSALIDHASPIFVQICTAHELGHAIAGVRSAHGPNWHDMAKRILVAEGLTQYAHPKYYGATAPAALWKLHMKYEVKKGRPEWPKF